MQVHFGAQGSKFQPCPAPHGPSMERVPLKARPGNGAFLLGHPERGQLEKVGVISSGAAPGPWLSHFCSQHQTIHSSWHTHMQVPQPNTAGCPSASWKPLAYLRGSLGWSSSHHLNPMVPGMPTSDIPQGPFSISLPLSALVPAQGFTVDTLQGLPSSHLGNCKPLSPASSSRVSGVRRTWTPEYGLGDPTSATHLSLGPPIPRQDLQSRRQATGV